MDRHQLSHDKIKEAQAIITSISHDIASFKPLGRMSELAVVMGFRPNRGVPITISAVGTVVFAKASVPCQALLDDWEAKYRRYRELLAEAADLDHSPILIDPRCTIGNQRAYEWGKHMQALGYTTPEEDAFLELEGRFWADHPTAKSGVVSKDGKTILPLDY